MTCWPPCSCSQRVSMPPPPTSATRMGSTLADRLGSFKLAAPTASELAHARAISAVLPLFPVIRLDPSPTAKRTSALVHAVSEQLTLAGVGWTAAFDSSPAHSNKVAPLFVLPFDLFRHSQELDLDLSDGQSSLGSSQELVPPSPACFPPSPSSRSASPAVVGDLHRLRTMVSTAKAQERLRTVRVAGFLGWRELELAARGCEGAAVGALPREWGEGPVAGARGWDEKNAGRRELDFSKRVAERRASFQLRAYPTADFSASALFGSSSLNEGTVHGSVSFGRPRSPRSPSFDSDASSLRRSVDPTTPRCAQAALPALSPDESSRGSRRADEEAGVWLVQADSYFGRSHDLERQGSGATARVGVQGVDPFHLPSLLHLVGLNLRLALLPGGPCLAGEVAAKGEAPGGGVGWLGRGVVVVGVFIGE